MRRILGIIGLLWLTGCGDVVRDEEDTTVERLAGVWDLVSNSPTTCYERIALNKDVTFWHHVSNVTYGGTWERDDNTINFRYTSKPWETFKFEVDARELVLVRMGVTKNYLRIPRSGYNSVCPKPPCTGWGGCWPAARILCI